MGIGGDLVVDVPSCKDGSRRRMLTDLSYAWTRPPHRSSAMRSPTGGPWLADSGYGGVLFGEGRRSVIKSSTQLYSILSTFTIGLKGTYAFPGSLKL